MLVVGAKGFAKELIEVLLQNNLGKDLVFYDDLSQNLPARLFNSFPILKSEVEAVNYFKNVDSKFVLGLGNPNLRHQLSKKFARFGGAMETVISPHCKIGRFGNLLETGVTILGDVTIEVDNYISAGTMIHVGSFISHDVKIGKFCEISPYVKLLGAVTVGDFCSLGTSCILLPKIKIGNNVTVGAGAVVTKDIPDNLTVVGVPARPMLK